MFSLTKSVVSDLIFAMEDQTEEAMVDTETGQIAFPGMDEEFAEEGQLDPAEDDSARWASLPPWSSAEGFRLMERFTDSVGDPSIKTGLYSALSARKGVFRAFKEELAPYPALQTRFFHFKDEQMRRVIRAWYDDLLEERGEADAGGDKTLESDAAYCDIVPIDTDRAILILEKLLESADPGVASLRAAELRQRLTRLEAAGSGYFLEARIPEADSDASDYCLAILLSEVIAIGQGHEGLSIFFLDAFPDYRGSGIDRLLSDRAKIDHPGPMIEWTVAE